MSDQPKASPPASITLTDSVAKSVTQQVSASGASVELSNSIATAVDQQVTLTGNAASSVAGKVATIEVKDGVVKEIHQVVNIHLGPGQSLDALFGANHALARRVYVSCGGEIRAYSVAAGHINPEPIETLRLPSDMGSARSVRLASVDGRLVVLAGCRTGVVAIDTGTAHAQVFRFPHPTRHGANSSLIHAGRLYATHSDFGLLRWDLEGGDPVTILPKPSGAAATMRNAQLDPTGRLLLSAGPNVLALDPAAANSPPTIYRGPAGAELVGIATCGPDLYAAGGDGRIFRWPSSLPGAAEQLPIASPIKTYCMTLAQLPDGPCLVLGVKDSALRILRLAPPQALIHYRASEGATIRWARAATDLLIATNADGTRLFFWRPEHPAAPFADLPACHGASSQITDLCILTA